MATFTIDLLTGDVYLFNKTFSSSGGTPTSGSTYPQVANYAALPSAAAHNGKIYVVLNPTGSYILNRKEAGLYYSNGLTWAILDNIPPYFASNNFQVYDSTVTSKGFSFVTSGITTGVFRKLKIQDSDGTIAYLTDLNAKLDKSVFITYTGNTLTLINTKASQASVATYTGVTAPASYVSKAQFNTYTGNTVLLLNAKLDKSAFVTFTGTTLPANYYNKSQINAYTGATNTLINTKADKSSIATYTGTTAPNQFASKSSINTYTGITAPNQFASKSSINTYTGITAPAQFVGKAAMNTFTGSTLPNNYVGKTQFNTYTCNTAPIINNAITGVTNLGSGNSIAGTSNRNATFKSIKAGAGIGISTTGTDITIYSTGGGTGSTPTNTTLQLIDMSGNTDVNKIASTKISWTTQVYSGTSLNFTGGSRIYIQSSGLYDISYVLNVNNNTNNVINIGSVIRKNGNTDITSMSVSSLSYDLSNKTSSNTMPQYITTLTSGDYVELLAFRIGNDGVGNTVPNGSWIKIKKL